MNALQVFVRNFQTQERATRIIESLSTMGFEVKECFDGAHDSLGGIIETHVAIAEELTTDDLDQILKEVAVDDDVFIQFRRYKLIDEGERRHEIDSQPSTVPGRHDG